MWQKIISSNIKPGQNKLSKVKKYFITLLLLQVLLPFNAISQTDKFNLEVTKFGVIEQALLNQAIDNDLQVKRLDEELNRVGLVRDIGALAATSNMVGVRIINLSSKDSSVRFITNGLQLGSDAVNISTFAYRMIKGKKIKEKMSDRLNIIKKDLFDSFSRLAASQGDIEAKNKLISYVGEKSTSDYLYWLESKSKGN